MKQRTIGVTVDAPEANRKEIANILAYYITGGDPAGYLARLAEKQQAEIESGRAERNTGRRERGCPHIN